MGIEEQENILTMFRPNETKEGKPSYESNAQYEKMMQFLREKNFRKVIDTIEKVVEQDEVKSLFEGTSDFFDDLKKYGEDIKSPDFDETFSDYGKFIERVVNKFWEKTNGNKKAQDYLEILQEHSTI